MSLLLFRIKVINALGIRAGILLLSIHFLKIVITLVVPDFFVNLIC